MGSNNGVDVNVYTILGQLTERGRGNLIINLNSNLVFAAMI